MKLFGKPNPQFFAIKAAWEKEKFTGFKQHEMNTRSSGKPR
jgi:hypothetical protein